MTPAGPAYGLLELCSIARGIVTCDAMVKRAPVRTLVAGSVQPGKFLVYQWIRESIQYFSIVIHGGIWPPASDFLLG